MSDTEKLDDEVRVIAEFGDVSDGTSYVEHGMAREIMRLRRILAALEGWSPDDVDRQYDALYALCGDSDDSTIQCAVANLRNANRIIRATLIAAKQEVGHE